MADGKIYAVRITDRAYFTLWGYKLHTPATIEDLSSDDLRQLNELGWNYTIVSDVYPEWYDPETEIDHFTELEDTFTSYTGLGGKGIRVKADATGLETFTIDEGTNTHTQIDQHISNLTNPHAVTHAQLVDAGTNNHATIDEHLSDISNPHSVIADQVAIEDVLDSFTATDVEAALAELKGETATIHVFANASTLDTYTQTEEDLDSAVGLMHTQNTDTGTTESSFAIDSDSANGVILKTVSGALELRDSEDTLYADLKVRNLTVEGTQTVINTTEVTISDNVVVLNSDATGTPTENAGLEVERGDLTNASIIWVEASDKWACGVAGSETAISLEGHGHTASDVSDFDTEVGNHTDVAANTGARHSHTNSAALDSITDAGSGSIITTEERNKLSGIDSGADVNQNAFSIIAVSGADNVEAETTTDTLTFVAGTGITLTTNATNDSVTFTNSDTGSGAVTTHESSYNHATFITTSSVTYETLNGNSDVGTTSGTLAAGDHTHSGVYEPVISTKNTAFNVNFGSSTGTAVEGNDSRLHEHSNKAVLDQVEAALRKVSFTAPDLGTATSVHAAITLADGTTTEVTTDITNPDMPRALTITGNAAGITGNVVIVGTNAVDEALNETIVASGTDTVVGTKAFKTVTSITVPARNAESDTISVGLSDKLGMGRVVTTGIVVAATVDGAEEVTKPTITKNATMALNLIGFSSALDGASAFVCYYIEG